MIQTPFISQGEIKEFLRQAAESPRRRAAKILHQTGAEFNKVVNFLMTDAYMQPHLHPSAEKIETITVLEGKLAVLFFDESGRVIRSVTLEKGKTSSVKVPAFAWHTYVILSDTAITYETMHGVYDPETWKTVASWTPIENTPEGTEYLKHLKERALYKS